jgi:hypothetical protein
MSRPPQQKRLDRRSTTRRVRAATDPSYRHRDEQVRFVVERVMAARHRSKAA